MHVSLCPSGTLLYICSLSISRWPTSHPCPHFAWLAKPFPMPVLGHFCPIIQGSSQIAPPVWREFSWLPYQILSVLPPVTPCHTTLCALTMTEGFVFIYFVCLQSVSSRWAVRSIKNGICVCLCFLLYISHLRTLPGTHAQEIWVKCLIALE